MPGARVRGGRVSAGSPRARPPRGRCAGWRRRRPGRRSGRTRRRGSQRGGWGRSPARCQPLGDRVRRAVRQLASGLGARGDDDAGRRGAQGVEVGLVARCTRSCSGPAAGRCASRRRRSAARTWPGRARAGRPNRPGRAPGWTSAMNFAMPAPKPAAHVRVVDVARGGEGGLAVGQLRGSGGSWATSVRTCCGWRSTSASALTAPPLLANRSTGPASSASDEPVQVVGVLLRR